MAKVIRNQWVYKKGGHWYRYLPRRNDSPKEFDYEKNMAGPECFPEKMTSSYLCSRLRTRYSKCQDIFETNVYRSKNITLIE
ncbi:unnamed protein product [Thelazia callipaeda]|uniref:Phage protein n=1 Tax=Thelazia callipaeda TaxID=103827 RepID=A0A0N5D6W6_THECL|nr:unnamed protein product [Thelazia callipaeda]